MAEIMNGAEGVALLEAFGFAEIEEGACLSMSFSHPLGTEGVPETVEVRISDAEGGAPDMDTEAFHAVAESSHAHIKAVVFSSKDARDLMALAIAVRNEQLVGAGDHGALPLEDTFAAAGIDGTSIHNAFGDEQYGDWAVSEPPGPTSIVLRDPVETYGAAYTAWRDARAEAVLAAAPAPRGPGR